MIARFVIAVLLCIVPSLAAATEITRVEGVAGNEAWLVEETAIPIVTVVIAFDGGARLDPDGKEGLARMTAALLTEGAGERDGQAFKRALEDRAIKVSADADEDTVEVTLQTLAANKDEAFALLLDALLRPRFEEQAIERIRNQLRAVLRQEAEDPRWIARRAFYAGLFAGHPYARSENGTPESLAAITRADIEAFARTNFSRDRMKIAIVGDLRAEDAKALLDRLSEALPEKGPEESAGVAEISTAPSLAIVERENPQSTLIFGSTGLLRSDPDYIPATVLNYILGGGGFSSRLMEEVREKRGLAYGVSTSLATRKLAGVYVGSVATDNARISESLALIRSEIARLRDEGPSEEEIADAKTYLTGSFALGLDSNAKIARFLIDAQLYDLGIDYINTRNAEIEAVTADDLKRVASRILRPEELRVTVVGKPEGLTATP
ncbi:MAG: insulinase family protein [Alphaproteobacteria bacterium]|nr:insulinase family protein [Alphaproteobacteria bacterium]